MAELVAQGLAVDLGGRPVLRGVSFRLVPGEVVALVGPNGAGKSTLLRCLSGTLRPGAGEVRLGGVPVHRLPPAHRARRIAVVAQELPGGFDFPVAEVVAMGRYPYLGRWRREGPGDRAAVAAAMAATGVEHLAERPFTALSGGERQRVAIARALAQEPEWLLLDEPANHLDLHHQGELFDLLVRLSQERGLGVVAVLHDLNLAALYSRRILMLHEGRLLADGPPAAVLTPRLLREVYGDRLAVGRHPALDRPLVALLPGATPMEDEKVRLAGGARAAGGLGTGRS
ncbi:MAG: heme ABC transporter ATP-binding protein [Bacillota bacterium]|nr:MAG: heme ABC transporter ATP-binding protein [Bacillota bacterium]